MTSRRDHERGGVTRPRRPCDPGPMQHATVASWRAQPEVFQDPLNALTVPARRVQRDFLPPVDVVVRVVWPRDGTEHVEARAVAYTTRAVLCHWAEPRLRILGAWFPPSDVERLTPWLGGPDVGRIER